MSLISIDQLYLLMSHLVKKIKLTVLTVLLVLFRSVFVIAGVPSRIKVYRTSAA
jgi:hypothetical protein